MTKYFIYFLFSLSISAEAYSQLTESEEELVAPSLSVLQDIDYMLEIDMKGLGSSQENLPFWMYNNQRGRIFKNSSFSGLVSGKGVMFVKEKTMLLAGASILYQNGFKEGLIPDELYAHFQNPWLYFTAGRKQRPVLYNGLSASNENILWSLNARPLPGLQLGTSGPLFLFGDVGPGFEASWNEYAMGKELEVQKAKLHHKSFHLLFRTRSDFQVRAGIQHFAHWGGYIPNSDELSENSKDYWEAVGLRNNLHTHMSSYEASVSQDFRSFKLELLYNHIATDRSGRLYSNSPDGRYGIFYEQHDKDQFINSVIYEFYYTKHQSYDSSSQTTDDYFNRYQYGEGWGYNRHFFGVPFFTYDPEAGRVANNKFTAHHFGIGGQFRTPFQRNPYRLLLSYARNHGTYRHPYNSKQSAFYSYLDIRILEQIIDVNLEVATEFNSSTPPAFGLAVHVTYKL